MRMPRELVSMVTLMVLLENCVSVCVHTPTPGCMPFNMKKGKGNNDWFKRRVALVSQGKKKQTATAHSKSFS